MDIQKKEIINLKNNLSKEATPPKVQNSEMPVRRYQPKNRSKVLLVILVTVLLGALSAVYYFYRQSSDLRKNSPAQASNAAEQQAKDVIAKVSRLIFLPQDEEPTVATVSDPEKLKDQPFFANAKAGDKVLIYSQAKKAILYDPNADKIVEVAPLNIGTTATSSSTVKQ